MDLAVMQDFWALPDRALFALGLLGAVNLLGFYLIRFGTRPRESRARASRRSPSSDPSSGRPGRPRGPPCVAYRSEISFTAAAPAYRQPPWE